MPSSTSFGRAAFLPCALLIFTASGFAGLIYESIWSHYLKLFLGHAAYAQTLVLAIFMGGMAIGAWGASRVSSRFGDLLVAYAVIEALIGVTSLVFHDVFVAATALAFDRVIPSLGSPAAVHAFKWSLAALLILPQSVLLGATFPFMTGGVLRLRPERAGYAVAMLYFTNSLGAAIGVLASGFYFIAAAGLPGTLVAAGVVNLTVAAAVMLLARTARGQAAAPTPPAPAAPVAAPHLKLLLFVAALTGASSFMYEIGWIRMLSLVLGSSTHAFELMLSAFILGIAFGGLAIRRRIDGADPIRLLGWVQVAMGIAALATLPVYGSTFRVMQSAMEALTPTAGGYVAFHFVSHAICLAVMFPAAFCAGMTLPLITAALLRGGAGERAIGQVYASNTAGAIVGVFLAVHLGMVLLGLKGLIVAGAVIDLALGVVLLGRDAGARRPAYAAAGLAAAAVIAATFVPLDAYRMASGVFRTGTLLRPSEGTTLAQFDGKTATISVTGGKDEVFALRTNGKSEGVIRLGPGAPLDDETMMTLLGALPQFYAPRARQAATIGFGTGLSSHVLLASPTLEALDTIEIEPMVVAAAQRFRVRNVRALEDPRSHVHFDDAKTYFSAQQKRYDVIISEPSNPWVSGVAGLFSVEFYRNTRRHLADGGLLFQWVHVYEMTPPLVATIIGALAQNFEDYELWLANHGDLIVVATPKGRLPRLDPAAFGNPALRAELDRFNIRNVDDLLLHRIGGRSALGPYYASFRVPPNSDFTPILDLNAAFARFLRQQVEDMPRLIEAPIPVVALFDQPRLQAPDPARLSPGPHPSLRRAARAKHAEMIDAYLRTGRAPALDGLPPALAADLLLVRGGLIDCRLDVPAATLSRALGDVAAALASHLQQASRQALWKRLSNSSCPRAAELRPWLGLHGALAAEGPKEIVATSARLLEGDLSPELAPYVVAAHMTGLLLSKNGQGALRSFEENRRKLAARQEVWNPVFLLLLGQASAK